MAHPSAVVPVKLFVVTLHRDTELLETVIRQMQSQYGNCDLVSRDFPFQETTYYEKEMGSGLSRRFYSFQRLISPDEISNVKIFTNRLEDQYAESGNRRINLDPGYLDHYKVVLASVKFGGQKIYLKAGIYADMTLVLYKGKWMSFPWGFPDFKSGKYDAILFSIRDLYKRQISGRTFHQRINNKGHKS